MTDIDELLTVLRDEITDLAASHFDDLKDAAVEDGEAFLKHSEDDLEEWTQLLATGELSQDEFRSLVEGKKDLAEMKALKQAGLAVVEVDKFRKALIERIVDTAGRVLI